MILSLCTARTMGLLPADETYACPGEVLMFTCQVSHDQQLHWMVQFVSVSMSPIEEFFLATDLQGKVIERDSNGISFVFLLTSNGSSTKLVSSMTVNATVSASQLLDGAQVHCGTSNSTMIYIKGIRA